MKYLQLLLCWLGWHPRPELEFKLEFWREHEDGTRYRVREIPGATTTITRECGSCGRMVRER